MGRPRLYRIKKCKACNNDFEPRGKNGVSKPNMKVCSIRCRNVLAGRAGKGRPTPTEVRDKIRIAQLGSRGNNWKGGIWSSQPQSERKSARYKTLRNEVMERDLFTCVICKETGVYLEVDHIKSYSKNPELRFEKSNLRTLCKPCHLKTPSFARG